MSVSFTPPSDVPPSNPPKNLYQDHPVFSTANAGFDPATFDQRAIAWTIDWLILLAVQKGLELAGSLSGLSSLITLAYFVIGHYKFECTAGKYFVGLRVHLVGDDSRKLGKIIFRETIGRFVSLVFLGFGYLAMLFSTDRATWHDRLSGTQVVSLNPVTGSTFGMIIKGFATLILFVVGISAFIVGQTLYSTAPLTAMESRLAMAGIHMTGLRGNMINGYEVDKITYDQDGNFVELNTIRLQVDPWGSFKGRKEFHLKHLTVQSGIVRLAPVSRKNGAEQKKPVAVERKRSAGNIAVLIDQVDINSIAFEGMEQKFELSRFFISNFSLNSEPLAFSMDRLYVDSSNFTADFPSIKIENEQISMQKATGKVKAAAFPDKLVRDIHIGFRVWGPVADKSFQIDGFNSQIKIEKQNGEYALAIAQWSPSNYFKGHYPISQISLTAKGKDFLKTDLVGEYFLRRTKIYVPAQKAGMAVLALVGRDSPSTDDGILGGLAVAKPVMIVASPLAHRPGAAWLKIADGVTKTEADSLSMLYFKRMADQLSPPEKAVIDADLTFFTTSLLPKGKDFNKVVSDLKE